MAEGIGMKTWQFQMIGAGATASGYTVTLYGTFDPAAYNLYYRLGQYAPNLVAPNTTGRGSVLLPSTSWIILPGASEQSGTGLSQNPMTSGSGGFTSQVLVVSLALVAVRAVASVATPTGDIQVLGFAIP